MSELDRNAIVDRLNDLIQVAEDRHQSFQRAAADVETPWLRSALEDMAATSSGLVRDLQARVAEIGGAPEASGTLLGGAQRLIRGLLAAITGRDPAAIVDALTRGETDILRVFAEARAEALPEPVLATLDSHIRQIENDRRRLQALRPPDQEAG